MTTYRETGTPIKFFLPSSTGQI